MKYKEVGSEFIILLKGQAAVLMPKRKRNEELINMLKDCGHDHDTSSLAGDSFVE